MSMKATFLALTFIIRIIALMVFISGVVITLLGAYEFFHALHGISHIQEKGRVALVGVGLLQAVDLFLVSIVLYVFALGLLILFNSKSEDPLPVNLPDWLKVDDFIHLKAILWEAILTTLVISFLAGLVEKKLAHGQLEMVDLMIPISIFFISISLFFLKRSASGH